MDGLTVRQRRFVEAYQGDATAAAVAAGYAPASAAVTGCKMLRIPKIRDAVRAREGNRLRDVIAGRDERMAFWSCIMRGGRLADGTVPRLGDRLKASELLARAAGDFLPAPEQPEPVTLTVRLPQTWGLDDGDGAVSGN